MRLFRKKQYDQMKINTTRKYLKYAFGEIILVMIGILLALQVSNWNENRKLKKKEVSIIQNLVEEIKFNNIILNTVKEADSINIASNRKILNIIKDKNSKYEDSMSYDFSNLLRHGLFITKKIAYENLKSNDFNVIKSDSIRSKISLIYEGLYSFLENDINDIKTNSGRTFKTLIQKSFEKVEGNRIVPNDYEVLKNNNEFINTLSFYIYDNQELYDLTTRYQLHLEKFQLEINDYLTEITKG